MPQLPLGEQGQRWIGIVGLICIPKRFHVLGVGMGVCEQGVQLIFGICGFRGVRRFLGDSDVAS